MSPLRMHLADYLATRRALGYELERAEQLLGQFIDYLEQRNEVTITIERALEWAALSAGSPGWQAHRLAAVRGFATHLRAIDPACEVPASELLPGRPQRAVPYLYSEEQIAALMGAAQTLRSRHRRTTYRTLIGLLWVTGMRIGEAIGLDRADIDWRGALIVVRDTKFGKSRQLPLHESVLAALRRYLRWRDRPRSATETDAVFVSSAGTRLEMSNVGWTFRRLAARAGIEPRSARCRPRLHDMRHSFAVRTLADAYRDDGDDVGARLALLCTYLGHVDPRHTYWYLEAAPELMQLAADRLERHLGGTR